MARHRIGSDELPLTQEFLSMMLAVRRAGVTTPAGALQQAGLIRYRHGRITVLDPIGLEEVSCECFGLSSCRSAAFMRPSHGRREKPRYSFSVLPTRRVTADILGHSNRLAQICERLSVSPETLSSS